jgi:hypothetical protein
MVNRNTRQRYISAAAFRRNEFGTNAMRQGWFDYLASQPFAQWYDRANGPTQRNYERGRQMAAFARLEGLSLAWPATTRLPRHAEAALALFSAHMRRQPAEEHVSGEGRY